MFKYMLSAFLLIATLLTTVTMTSNSAEARIKKKRKTHRTYKVSKHKRKSRHYKKHGNGPDLKAMTTNSPYVESPSNGVNPVETTLPTL